MIEIKDLTKTFKKRVAKRNNKFEIITALNEINLEIKKGEIFGLIGPNGAGKTTTLKILSTLIIPDKGTVTINGYDIIKEADIIKKQIGLLTGEFTRSLYWRLSGIQNLKFFAKIYNINEYEKKIIEVVEILGLTSKLHQLVETYSSGMKIKLALARILLINPQILILDEPMLGLDPMIVNELMAVLKNLNKTIMITSHQMNVVEAICSKIGFLKEGNIIKVDTTENFVKFLQKEIRIRIEIGLDRIIQLIDELSTLNYISDIEHRKDVVYFNIKDRKCYPKIFGILQKYPITQIKEIEFNLEDLFIKLNA